jgi:hypothetical protein
MSKPGKKIEQLPLDSPNWMPAAEAYRLLTGLLGNPLSRREGFDRRGGRQVLRQAPALHAALDCK